MSHFVYKKEDLLDVLKNTDNAIAKVLIYDLLFNKIHNVLDIVYVTVNEETAKAIFGEDYLSKSVMFSNENSKTIK